MQYLRLGSDDGSKRETAFSGVKSLSLKGSAFASALCLDYKSLNTLFLGYSVFNGVESLTLDSTRVRTCEH